MPPATPAAELTSQPTQNNSKKHDKDKKHKKDHGHDKKSKTDKKEKKDKKRARTDTPEQFRAASANDEPPAPKKRNTVPAPPWVVAGTAGAWTMPSYVQLDPTLCLVFGVGSLTIDTVGKEAARLGSPAQLISSLNRIAENAIQADEPWIAGTAWGLAYLTDAATSANRFSHYWERSLALEAICCRHSVTTQ